MEVYKKKRKVIKGALTRFANGLTNDIDLDKLKLCLEKNENLFERFDEVQSEIDILCTEQNDISQQETERAKFENEYYNAIAKAREMINKQEHNIGSSSVKSHSTSTSTQEFNNGHSNHITGAVLPKLCIPKFNGDYNKWVKFRDTFNALIHNNSELSNIQKFTYLEDALIGKAANVITSLGVSNENYVIAWEKVRSRYEDSNELKQHHLRGLFEAQTLNKNSHDDLRQLIDVFSNHLSALNSLKEKTENWDTVMIYLLTSKLNTTVRHEWERTLAQRTDTTTFKIMMEFLEAHCKLMNKLNDTYSTGERKDNKSMSNYNHASRFKSKSYVITNKICPLCKSGHALYGCEEFKKLTIKARIQRVRELRLCFNCLDTGHLNKDWKLGSCKKCGRKHNSLLHIEPTLIETISEAPQAEYTQVNNAFMNTQPILQTENSLNSQRNYKVNTLNSQIEYVLLGTGVVYLYDRSGNVHECRALLDSCSQPHLITASFAKGLNLPIKKGLVTLSGIEHGRTKIQGEVSVKLKSRVTDFSSTFTCLVLDEIDNKLPSHNVASVGVRRPTGIKLADPEFDQSKPIDLLIGAGKFNELLCIGQIRIQPDQPIFQKTLLGWIASGNIFLPSTLSHTKCNLIQNKDLHHQIEQFWKIENCFTDTRSTRNTVDPAEIHFQKTTNRDERGRFIVSIPFNKEKLSHLGDSKEIALKRLYAIEKKLERNLELKEQYVEFMKEYLSLGHMSEVSNQDVTDNKQQFYLPHHFVCKTSSTTTKLRVVFDGSAKTSTGISLNNTQYIGTTVQDDLFSIILRFWHHRYVISADIAKMYRQILIKPEERALQRIFWRDNSKSQVKSFELNTVTYGTASAPFLATRCMYQLGTSCKEEYPLASKTIIHDFYVDDLLSGTDNLETAKQLKLDLENILGRACFNLRKWASNESSIIEDTNELTSNKVKLQGDKDPKTLGLIWDSKIDSLQYRVTHGNARKVTKRIILSIIAQIYDPLGLVGPLIIPAKILMQAIWGLNLNWDESLPQHLHLQWEQIYSELMSLNSITINRHVLIQNSKKHEYHGFCDASETAYGACIYVTSIAENGSRDTHLLCAKSRVAPLKTLFIPRLELLGAVLLAQLAHKVSTACGIDKEMWYYWTDSMVTLAWITAPANRWKTFIANRTTEIQELTAVSNWNHIESFNNPADLISRGTTVTELKASHLWWHGPKWLAETKFKWPKHSDIELTNVPEQRQVVFITKNITKCEIFSRFSSFTRLIRSIAYILRFVQNCKLAAEIRNKQERVSNQRQTRSSSAKTPISKQTSPLSNAEVEAATCLILKCAQSDMFRSEMDCLSKGHELTKNSNITQLNPFIDDSGLLRVGGRLQMAKLPFNHKHPVILEPNHEISQLIIKNEHVRLLHAGCQAVLSSLRERYWIIRGKNTIKKLIRHCVTCFRVRPKNTTYIMGNLPAARVASIKPFFNSGVDYAGPILIQERGRARSAIKSYICIFICLATRAVHIELSVDLSTNSFLNCFKRFISRRRMCRNIYSDNGLNFVGANKELSALNRFLNGEEFKTGVVNHCTVLQVNWHFNPPSAPHFGGIWEAAVKSAKHHLRRVIGETKLTFEELYTLLTQVEACLNSRPLSPISDDPEDLTPLTPGHFLVGDSLTALPERDIQHLKVGRLDRYQHLQYMLQHFWKRWYREYLPQLQTRQKWNQASSQVIKPNAMVLISRG